MNASLTWIMLSYHSLYSSRRQLNLSLDKWNSIANVRKVSSVSKSSFLSQNNSTFVIAKSFRAVMFSLEVSLERGLALQNNN